MIIHISGPSGSGKTTLGNKLKKKFGNKIIVKDLDDLRDKFIKSYYGEKRWTFINVREYQKYINDYIKKHSKKLIIFVGLNDNTIFGRNKELYYNVHSDYNFYIKIDDNIIIEQKCKRFINEELPNIVKQERKDLAENNEFFIKQIIKVFKNECSAKQTIKLNNKWKKDYKKMNYKFMSRENILKEVSKIIKTN
jgi:adenylate kinase family enzyme